MLTVSNSEKALCDSRPNAVDHERTAQLHYLGNYLRKLPVSMARMMENARDWEHLPYVHASSFCDITGISHGHWGWRAKARPAAEGSQDQLLELLIDYDRNYWATTILSGPAAGVEVHTEATSLSGSEIEIDVRFYNGSRLTEEESALYHEVLKQQYALLYDEDVPLMRGRQQALEDQRNWRAAGQLPETIFVGDSQTLPKGGPTIVNTSRGRYVVRYHNGRWIAHSAVCAHQLGPLDNSALAGDGSVTCPWHGYRFCIETGNNLDGRCGPLESPPSVDEHDGKLHLVFAAGARRETQ